MTWNGDENVLDVGCGRGLLLLGAAKRLKTGRATGLDLWQSEDLTGNSAEATLENARREGVADRVDVRTANMTRMPFEDSSFDVILSRAAIHNIYSREGRDKAVREIARVLKPGGRAVLDDIRHHKAYARILVERGCSVQWNVSWLSYVALTILTFGSLRPAILLVTKSAKKS